MHCLTNNHSHGLLSHGFSPSLYKTGSFLNDPFNYIVELRAYNESYPDGVAAKVTVHVAAQTVHYVSLDSLNQMAPYSS